MINLPDVTLLAVTSINIKGHIKSLERSSRNISFSEVVLLSDQNTFTLPSHINYRKIPRLVSIDAYNYFILYDLYKYVESNHVLLVQADSWVINPMSWREEFLEYDYIGAPWPLSDSSYITPSGEQIRVGNGGFSLRSYKLLSLPSLINVPFNVDTPNYKNFGLNLTNEDGNICVHNRYIYETNGCKFAPLELAMQFSFESNIPEYNGEKPFGFHKNHPNRFTDLLLKLGKKMSKLG